MISPEKLREIGSFHIGTDIQSRLATALEWQAAQKKALDEAAATIETLQAEITAMKESKYYEVRT